MEKIITIPKFQIDKEGWKKVGKGALIALGGAVLTVLEELIPSVNFGAWTVIVFAANSMIINLVKVWLSNYKVMV